MKKPKKSKKKPIHKIWQQYLNSTWGRCMQDKEFQALYRWSIIAPLVGGYYDSKRMKHDLTKCMKRIMKVK